MKRRLRFFGRLLIMVLFMPLLLSFNALLANELPFWGNLQPGQYGVGFQSVEKYDNARVYGAKNDYLGNPTEGNRSRKIQICIWYPAVAENDALQLVYGEYSFSYPENDEFYDFLDNIHDRRVGRLFGALNRNGRLVAEFMNLPMAGVRNATAAAGKFPLIIYFSSNASGYLDNVALCEYLASHGFIVAATHPVGAHRMGAEASQIDIETAVRDAEFIFSFMSDYPNIDKNKLGTLGFETGGAAALLFQMRNSDVDAVAGLASPYTSGPTIDLIQANSYYNAGGVTAPVLNLQFVGEEPPDMKLLDSMIHSSRHMVTLNGTNAMNYSIAEAVMSMIPESGNALNEAACPNYETVGKHVYNFFHAYLNKDEGGLKFMSGQPADNGFDPESVSYAMQPGEEIPPTSDQFMAIITTYGASRGVELYEKFNSLNPGSLIFPEATFNAMGYRLMGQGQIADACKILELNTIAYPHSANVWDSYADGLLAAGDDEAAANCYHKLLEALPGDSAISEGLSNQLRTNAENFLNTQAEGN